MSESKYNLKKIDGWLIFFIVTIIFFLPVLNIYEFFKNPIFGIGGYFDLFGMVTAMISSGIFLLFKKSYSITFTKAVLISFFIATVVYFPLKGSILVINILYPIIWFVYFSYSKKMNVIYGKIKPLKNGKLVLPIFSMIYSIISPILGLVMSIFSLKQIRKNKRLKGFRLSVFALVISIILIIFAILDLIFI
ncbi:MAG: hypothetical protein AABW50_01455 [Nanoarchaeota archaeon]